MNVVAWWTGGRADILRQALRMTNEAFAAHLGVAERTVAYRNARPDVAVRPVTQQILDVALAQASEQVRDQFRLLLAERGQGQGPPPASLRLPASDDVASLTGWITSSDTSDEAIERTEPATVVLADRHTQVTARRVLADVLQLHGKTQTLLRSGKQRPRQTRELTRIDSDLLAHASVLLGDLGRDQAARHYGNAALIGTQEAETSQARACYALAKTARWQHHYADAADLALRGFDNGPVSPLSMQLAYYEANAAALAGDTSPARTALARAETIAGALPPRRHRNLPLVLLTGTAGDVRAVCRARHRQRHGALRAAPAADEGWAAGDPHIPGHAGTGPDRRGHRAPAQRLTRRSGRAGNAHAGDAARIPDRHRHRLAGRPRPPPGRLPQRL